MKVELQQVPRKKNGMMLRPLLQKNVWGDSDRARYQCVYRVALFVVSSRPSLSDGRCATVFEVLVPDSSGWLQVTQLLS